MLRLTSAILLVLFTASCEPREQLGESTREVIILDPSQGDEAEAVVEEAAYFRSEAGAFQIDFPEDPEERAEMVETELGRVEIHIFSFEYSLTLAYWVSYSDHPTEMLDRYEKSDILVLAREGIVGNLGQDSEILEEQFSSPDEMPSLYFRTRNGSFHAVYKLVLNGNRLYQVGLLQDGMFPSEEEIERFIGSFEIVS